MNKGVSILIVGNAAVGKSVLARLLESVIPGVVVVDDVAAARDLVRIERSLANGGAVIVTAPTDRSDVFREAVTFDIVIDIQGASLGGLLMGCEGGAPMRSLLSCVGERRRQTAEEAYDTAHDDRHTDGELAQAATYYAMPAWMRKFPSPGGSYGSQVWPWEEVARKPSPDNRKREIEKAVALLLAEWERLDRIEQLQRRAAK